MATSLETMDVIVEASEPGRAQWPLIRTLMQGVEAVAAALLVVLISLILTGVFFRFVLNAPLIWIDEAASLTFIWLSMLGAAIAIDRNEHLRLTLFFNLMAERIKPFVSTLALAIVALFLAALLPPAIDHVRNEWIVISPALELRNSFRVAALAAGVGLMLLLVVGYILRNSRPKDIAAAAIVLGSACLVLWAGKPFLVGLGQINIVIFLVAIVAVCLAIGVPIAFCFGVGTMAFLAFSTRVPVSVMVGRMDEGMSGMVLLSVPVFILLGCILDATGMGKAIVDFLSSMIGHVRAGMSYVLLASLYLVSGISGSKVSDMATVAPALFPEMKRRGNKPPEMIALLATGAVMADTVPPSIVLIVLGSVAGLSIASLFTSGFVIAFFLAILLAVVARWRSASERLDGVRRAPLSLIWKTMVVAVPALVLPFLIRAAVGGGAATATEVSTVAVLYALGTGLTLYGGFGWRRFYSMLVETAALSGAVLLIMGCALAAAWALTQTGFARDLAAMIKDLPGGWVSFMAVTILTFVVLGCLLEGLPALVLLAPVMFPIAKDLGINGIHYAMVVVVAMNIGLFIPPIGIGFYIACSIGKVPPDQAMRAVWIYLLALVVGLVVIALVPALSTAYL